MAKSTNAAVSTAEQAKVVVYTPEQREEVLKKRVSQEVKALPVVERKLAQLKAKYATVTISGIDDKKGYEAVKAGIRDLTSFRTATTAKSLEITKDYKDIISGIKDFSKNIVDQLSDIEQPLRDAKLKYEADLEAEKKRKEAEEQKRIDDRIAQVKESGLSFDGSFYVLGSISVDLVTIKKMPDDKFLMLQAKAKAEAEKIAEEEAEKERIREEEREKAKQLAEKQEAERQKLEQERLELQKLKDEQEAEIKRMRDEAEAQRAEMAKMRADQQKELDRIKKEAEDAAAAAEREKIEAKAKLIGYKLEAIGFRRVGDHYDYFDSVISKGVKYDIKDMMSTTTDEEIEALVSTLSIQMQKVKDERHTQDEALEIARKQEQEAKDAAAKKIADEKEAARKAALPDVEKIHLYISGVMAANLQLPDSKISNPVMQKSLQIATSKISDILEDLKKSVDTFTK